MKKIKIKLIKVFTIGVIASLAFNFASPKFFSGSTAYAVGDLDVIWGVPDGQPIFVVTNMMPGDIQTRSVNVKNNATVTRPVAVRGIKTSETKNFSQILEIVISESGTDLYGGTTGTKTLAQFFTDSGGSDGIFLSNLSPSATTTYSFKVTFPTSAGNPYQEAIVVFDLKIGIAIQVPAECQDIQFSGQPIFGTENRDVLNGTNGNDLIFAFEGDDKVNGSNGNDCIVGNEGDDKLNGSNGEDVIFGNNGDDTLDGSNGEDLLIAGEGNDRIFGTNGNDRIFAGDGDDKIEASNGDDYVIAGPGNDKIDAGNGNDYVDGNEGDDQMRGRNGNDTLIGGTGTDKAFGDLGTDTCVAEVKTSCEI